MDDDMELWKIIGVNKGIINAIGADRAIGCMCHWIDVKPVKFRPYAYEEAVKLLGKQMEYFSWDGENKHLMIITDVGESEDGCLVNFDSYTYWSNRHATINGIPLGVPEVDEDALKGGSK